MVLCLRCLGRDPHGSGTSEESKKCVCGERRLLRARRLIGQHTGSAALYVRVGLFVKQQDSVSKQQQDYTKVACLEGVTTLGAVVDIFRNVHPQLDIPPNAKLKFPDSTECLQPTMLVSEAVPPGSTLYFANVQEWKTKAELVREQFEQYIAESISQDMNAAIHSIASIIKSAHSLKNKCSDSGHLHAVKMVPTVPVPPREEPIKKRKKRYPGYMYLSGRKLVNPCHAIKKSPESQDSDRPSMPSMATVEQYRLGNPCDPSPDLAQGQDLACSGTSRTTGRRIPGADSPKDVSSKFSKTFGKRSRLLALTKASAVASAHDWKQVLKGRPALNVRALS